uniref:Uncharacterized protein n=1 Tax=Medicago truncatula TaxID=3880 RepID=A2Q145_MEDTR|nr:hypothetical protein MtrDRAFT_AC147481g26v2 [Medicago truncatula]
MVPRSESEVVYLGVLSGGSGSCAGGGVRMFVSNYKCRLVLDITLISYVLVR